MLYPLKFQPRLLEKMWGGRKLETLLGKRLPPSKPIGESWELYDFPPGVIDQSGEWVSSVVANGPLAGRTLHELIGDFGTALHGDVPLIGPEGQFPILIKFLDARENLSVQVHPDAAYAAANPGTYLKTEAWYIIDAEAGSMIYKGLKVGVDRARLRHALATDGVEEMLNKIAAKAGHHVFLPSGTVHALGGGILLAEIQTPSDTTFRLFDFNRIDPASGQGRRLHISEALDCIDFDPQREPPQRRDHVAGLFTTVSRLVTCPYFKLEKVRFTEGVEEPVPYDEPVVWIMLEGRARITVDRVKEVVTLVKGETILLPARMQNPVIKTESDCVWLEVTFATKGEVR
jgi:mannose-6-phosphate isomerase